MTTIFNNNSCKEKKKTNFLGEAIKLYFKAKKLEKSVQWAQPVEPPIMTVKKKWNE